MQLLGALSMTKLSLRMSGPVSLMDCLLLHAVPPSVDAVNNSGGGPCRARHPAAKIGLRPDVRLGLAGSSI